MKIQKNLIVLEEKSMLNFKTFHQNKLAGTMMKHQLDLPGRRIKAPNLKPTSFNPMRRTIAASQIGTQKLSIRNHLGINRPINR